MIVYIAFMKRSFKQLSVYRSNSYFSIFSSFVGLFILYHVWTALYAGKVHVNGITLDQMLVYIAISTLVIAVTKTRIHNEIGLKVREGSLSIDFIKPIDFKWHLFANQIGENAFGLFFHALPAFLAALLLWQLDLQISYSFNGMFLISLVLGALLHFQISYLLGLSVMWLQSSFFVDWVLQSIMRIFAGSFVPLWFYPDAILRISNFLPFKYIIFEPISIYMGKTTLQQTWVILAIQCGWLVLLLIAEKIVWFKVNQKIDINGG
ncbi:ABC transporter permease [Paenibacillus sp. strain BS8-2]